MGRRDRSYAKSLHYDDVHVDPVGVRDLLLDMYRVSGALRRRLRHPAQFLHTFTACHSVQELPTQIVVVLQTAVELRRNKQAASLTA